jgi:hypothetical protein
LLAEGNVHLIATFATCNSYPVGWGLSFRHQRILSATKMDISSDRCSEQDLAIFDLRKCGLLFFKLTNTLWVVSLLTCLGCSSVTVRPDGMVERHYLGYVKLLVPPSVSKSSRVWSADITALGIRIQDGLGIGYFRDQEVVTPLECHVVVLVKSKLELDQFIAFYERMKGGTDICAAIQESH